MRMLALGAMLFSLSLFVAGCNETAKQKDTSERTVKTDKDTGETVVKEEEQHTGKDTETGAKVDTSVEKETTIKPAQENDRNVNDEPAATENETPVDNAPATPDEK